MFKTITKFALLATVALATTVFLAAPGILTLASMVVVLCVVTRVFCE